MNFFIKQNDTSPAMSYKLYTAQGAIVNLEGAAVRFMMEDIIDAPAAVVANQGEISYNWQQGDTAKAGTFKAEFQVNYANGGIETFPNGGYILVTILPEL